MHFGRSKWEYPSSILGCHTRVLAVVQRFAAGAVAASPQFTITLDGEGVDLTAEELALDFGWEDREAASAFQTEIMPLLSASPLFRLALSALVEKQQHLRLVEPGRLTAVEPGIAPAARS
jgi:hypothetical protein